METLLTFGRRALAWSLFFLCWFLSIRWLDERHDRLFWGLLIGVTAGAWLFVVYLDRRSLRMAKEAARAQRELDVLRLAEREGGQLTATLTAARLGWPMGVALATLRSLEDGVRVTTLVAGEGVRLFEFPDLIHAPRVRERVR
jgi:hypothetical protein